MVEPRPESPRCPLPATAPPNRSKRNPVAPCHRPQSDAAPELVFPCQLLEVPLHPSGAHQNDSRGQLVFELQVCADGCKGTSKSWQGNTVREAASLCGRGKERQDSVLNGFGALSPEATSWRFRTRLDHARPALIEETIEAARVTGQRLPPRRTDTIKESADGELIERTVDRSRLWAVQTPQSFRVPIIRSALAEARRRGWPLRTILRPVS